MIIYRAKLHRYAPELCRIQKCSINKKLKTIRIIDERKLPNEDLTAYKCIIGHTDVNQYLNKEYFDSLEH